MPLKLRGNVILDNLTAEQHVLSHGTSPTENLAAGITLVKYSRPPQRCVFTFTAAVLSMAAADDFGSLKICDLPNADVVIVGAKIDITAVMAGFASNVGTTLDVACGTVATASAAFSNAGEKDILPKFDATGAGTTATVTGRGTATEANKLVTAGTNAIYLNASSPVTSGTGTLTISGTIELLIQFKN